jgi:hypothetical protein
LDYISAVDAILSCCQPHHMANRFRFAIRKASNTSRRIKQAGRLGLLQQMYTSHRAECLDCIYITACLQRPRKQTCMSLMSKVSNNSMTIKPDACHEMCNAVSACRVSKSIHCASAAVSEEQLIKYNGSNKCDRQYAMSCSTISFHQSHMPWI